MKALAHWYSRFSLAASYLQSPFLLAVRVYWGWQFAVSGWGKLHNIPRFTSLFTNLNIPFPAANAHFVAGLEFFGGILLILGLGSRLVSLLMVGNMLVAYWTADRDALVSVFSDQFTSAAEITFLVASLIILVFGAGLFSIDALLKKRLVEQNV
jgi:putative oxidoreductase